MYSMASMYGILIYMYHEEQLDVGKHTIHDLHGWYRYDVWFPLLTTGIHSGQARNSNRCHTFRFCLPSPLFFVYV